MVYQIYLKYHYYYYYILNIWFQKNKSDQQIYFQKSSDNT